MNLATWSIRNPTPSILLFLALAVAGIWGFHRLPVQNLPDLELPTVIVTLAQPGAAPAQLETEVARKVENALATLAGLKHQRTLITDGQVQITAEFVLEKKLSDALIETKNAVDGIRSDLPPDLLQPQVNAVNIGSQAVLVYAVGSTDRDEESLSWFVDNTVAKAVLTVPGVAQFTRLGGVQREVRIEIDPAALSSLGVTVPEISRQLRLMQQESSGGKGRLGLAEQSVRTIGTVQQASDLETFPIVTTDGRRVRLDQVANVSDTFAERTEIALLDGRPVVGFKIYRAKGCDEIQIADGVKQVLARLQATHPSATFTPISGTADYTREQYLGSMHMLFDGGLLAMVVVWWFLRDWRATLIAAAALPLSILPAFAAMAWLGFSLNSLSLLALAVVVGVLVDDAIVEIENIERHCRMGKPIREATTSAVTEIALAVIATTMTIVVVFLPTAMMSGISGLFFKQFGWTAVIAVLASLLVARLLTPTMAAHFLRSRNGLPRASEKDSRIMRWYLSAVRWCLTHRKTTVAAALAVFVGSLLLVPLIPTGLIPAADRGYCVVEVELPPGSSLEETQAATEKARQALAKMEGIRSVFTVVGGAQQIRGIGTQAGETRKATLTVLFQPRGHRPGQTALENAIRQQLHFVPGARFSIGDHGGPGERLQIILASDNAAALRHTAQALERQLRDVPGLHSVESTATLEQPEIVIRPDAQRAAERGVVTTAIGDVARIATSGDFDAQVAKLNLDDRQIAIRVRMADSARQDINSLANLRVASPSGPVPLASVATLSLASGPAQIDRFDRERYVAITADLGGMPLGDALEAAKALPAVRSLPSSVRLIETGDAEIMAEMTAGFTMAISVGLLLVLCVLILLFRDFLQPVTILSAIPLSLAGAIVALLLARSQFDIPSAIGLLMLIGIVTKNSILLVEYAFAGQRTRGLSLSNSLIEACQMRARPIVMTSLAMIAGMLPVALGLGADSSFRWPMAIAVIGGLITSTGLSLLVVPVFCLYMKELSDWLKRSLARKAEDPAAALGNCNIS